MVLSKASLDFLKEQGLNSEWEGLTKKVAPVSITYTNVYIKRISR